MFCWVDDWFVVSPPSFGLSFDGGLEGSKQNSFSNMFSMENILLEDEGGAAVESLWSSDGLVPEFLEVGLSDGDSKNEEFLYWKL